MSRNGQKSVLSVLLPIGMLGFAPSFLAWLASTAIPAIAGLSLVIGAGRFVKDKYLAAFALGIFFWFFVDTISGSADLDVNAGFTGGMDQVAIVALFVVGVLFFLGVDRDVFSSSSSPGGPSGGAWRYGLAVPLLVAVAVGIHGFGEGAAFGGTAVSTQSTDLLDAFGGLSAGVAYVLHKMLEPMMIGACYVVYSKGQGRTAARQTTDILLLGLVFVIPSLIGAATGYYLTYDSSYLFALGTGTSIYAAIRLANPLFTVDVGSEASKLDSHKKALSLVLGFLSIYLAALFHS